MRYQSNIVAIVITISAIILGCGPSEEPEFRDASLPDGFIEFYTLFNHDTAYQYEHISFPLPGLRADGILTGSESQESQWTRQEWIPHRKIKLIDQYQQSYNVLGESMVVETISEIDGPNAMQRRFALTSDGWQLIYYIEMQPLSQSN